MIMIYIYVKSCCTSLELFSYSSFDLLVGRGQFGERDLVRQAKDYLRCSSYHPVNFQRPKVHFAFYNQVFFHNFTLNLLCSECDIRKTFRSYLGSQYECIKTRYTV